ncbi:Protein CBG25966 [Caenorhabditis briggsae]|uniref:Protein CBG25966 n=1 Tax=Caenorhabditis briggsae TaxID=6238 RepID=B6IKR6_CAEBR|nr:Protein CBG25966 [Caenorhabditis briggsae]CAS00496.1 Protein CBG25966 [Caenorhabditis briggsae]
MKIGATNCFVRIRTKSSKRHL